MAVSVADMNQIRVDVLGRSVDQPGATWTTVPPANANTLNTTQRIINRAINDLNSGLTNALSGTTGFDSRFTGVVGDEAVADQAAFASIGNNLIQAVAALVTGAAIAPVVLIFEFTDPVDTNDYLEIIAPADCTIPQDLDDTQYVGNSQSNDMLFELTAQPSGDVIGQIMVAAGNLITLSGAGAEVAQGTTLRMTATDIVAGPLSPTAVISVIAARKAAPATAGRFEFAQSAPDTEWTIQHMLGQRIVKVQIVDSSGASVLADVDFESANRCVVSFARPKAGTAVVRR